MPLCMRLLPSWPLFGTGRRTGEGQYIDISMQEAMVSIMEGAVVRWSVGKELLSPIGSHNTNESPMAAYRCKDGYIIIGTVGNEHFERFCRAIGKPEWTQDPQYATKGLRWAKKWELAKEIEKITTQYTVKELEEKTGPRTGCHFADPQHAAGSRRPAPECPGIFPRGGTSHHRQG